LTAPSTSGAPDGVLDDGSTIRAAAWRFVLQRASAAVLALCVVVHLATIIYAVRHGLTSDAMIARMHANPAWPAFYAVFVIAAAIHAPLGIRAIADEWLGWHGRAVDSALGVLSLVLFASGLYAVHALTA
jgi:fumarate reductase subunit C